MRLFQRRRWLYGLCLLPGIAAGVDAADRAVLPVAPHVAAAPAVPVAPDEILAISPAMRDLVDRHIRPISGQEKQARALLDLMFAEEHLGLGYDRFGTRTAAQTVEAGSGNCLSLASTFISMARYAGLDASYIAVSTPDVWYPGDEVFYVLKHTTAGVKLGPRATMFIEFNGVPQADHSTARPVEDARGFAQYYSNIASMHLAQSDFAAASLGVHQALRIEADYSPAWNTLGVIQKRLGSYDAAETSYRKSLQLDSENLSALNNLVILYEHTGRTADAAAHKDKLERYRRRNPYYLNHLAEEAVASGNYESAIGLAKKAVRKRNVEHRFHFTLAQAYSALERPEQADRHLQQALAHADSDVLRARYRREFNQRRQLQSGITLP